MSTVIMSQDLLIHNNHPGPQTSKLFFISVLLLVIPLFLRFRITTLSAFHRAPYAAGDLQNEVPSAVPIFGHYFSLISAPAETLRRWAQTYGDVFIVKIGNRRITIVNGGKAAREIYARHSNALNSRPEMWTYHHMFSHATKPTMSSTPFNQMFANARKAAPFSQAYLSRNLFFIDQETRQFLKECLDSEMRPVDPIRMLQRMNTSMNLNMCWGRRVESLTDPFFQEITDCEYKIVELRNMYTNLQDGMPLLRSWPFGSKSQEAIRLRRRRDAYLESLNQELDQRIARDETVHCLRAELLEQGDKFTDEMALLCVTMLAAGVGPTAAALHWGLALLAVRRDIQDKAYKELHSYKGGDPSTRALDNMSDSDGCPYISAVAQEILRYFTPTRLGLPRLTTKDISYNGKLIPKGSTVVMNAWACNRDSSYWPMDPNIFMPERWLNNVNESTSAPVSPQHFTFSLGARSCAGTVLAKRLSYIFYARLISAFELRLPEDSKFTLDALSNSTWEAMLAQPKDLKVVFVPRDKQMLSVTLGAGN